MLLPKGLVHRIKRGYLAPQYADFSTSKQRLDLNMRLLLSMNRPRFVIANEVRRSIAEKAPSWTAALRSQ